MSNATVIHAYVKRVPNFGIFLRIKSIRKSYYAIITVIFTIGCYFKFSAKATHFCALLVSWDRKKEIIRFGHTNRQNIINDNWWSGKRVKEAMTSKNVLTEHTAPDHSILSEASHSFLLFKWILRNSKFCLVTTIIIKYKQEHLYFPTFQQWTVAF